MRGPQGAFMVPDDDDGSEKLITYTALKYD